MSKDIDQKTVDQKIQRFLARKTPMRTLGKIIAGRLGLTQPRGMQSGISYERI